MVLYNIRKRKKPEASFQNTENITDVLLLVIQFASADSEREKLKVVVVEHKKQHGVVINVFTHKKHKSYNKNVADS